MRCGLITLFLLVCSDSVAAQGFVTGNVTSDTGSPIQGLPVIVQNEGNQSVAITGQDGSFEAPVPDGSGYSVTLPNPNHPPIEVPQAVKAGTVNVGAIKLPRW